MRPEGLKQGDGRQDRTSEPRRNITIALAGNPNSGKTTVFNGLAGARQHVGNYPGVTVEKKEGHLSRDGRRINVVDLPGTYSLTAYSLDEIVARDYVTRQQPDVVIDVIDASNLERNLYLAVQLMEIGAPLVLAFNMSDLAEANGFSIDTDMLSSLLGVPIVRTVGHKREGFDELLDVALALADSPGSKDPVAITYGREIEKELETLATLIERYPHVLKTTTSRWIALKLIEGDENVAAMIREQVDDPSDLFAERDATAERITAHFGDRPEIVIADRRYGFISGACQGTVRATVESRHRMSDRIDSIVTNRVLGIPIFLALMYIVFKLTFTLGDPPMQWLDAFFGWLGQQVSMLWPRGSESAIRSLLVDGVIGGVAGVLSFLPNILLLFMAIALLEDSGYMARAAFMMDRLMHKIGLHGKSFIPMLIGFGCSVPAIMATRMLDNRRDRLTTMLVLPLMSCGARLTIYTLLIPAFFPLRYRSIVMWTIYLTGIILAIVLVKLLRSTMFRGETNDLVMELPPYRLPTFNGILLHTWERGRMYVKKVGTIILAISLVLWVLTSYPRQTDFSTDYAKISQRARSEYIAFADKAAEGAGVDPELLKDAVDARLRAAEKQQNHYEHEEGYAEAEREKQKTIEKIRKAPGGAEAVEFLDLCDAIAAERKAFEKSVDEMTEDAGMLTEDEIANTEAYKRAKADHEARIEELREKHPQTFAHAVAFLDEGKLPFEKAESRIENEKAGEALRYTVAGRIGQLLVPITRPLGFDWRVNTALIGALAAKEVFVAQMGIVFSLSEGEASQETLRAKLRAAYSPFQAFSILLFCLISAPCVATLAITRQESGSWRWAVFQFAGLTALAYAISFMFYQVGSLVTGG